MNFKKTSLLCCMVVTPLAILASQPRGKFGGMCSRQQTKKDLRVGPERSQQRKQGAWEMLQAKKAQQVAQVFRATSSAVKNLPQSLPVSDLPFMHERQNSCSTHYRTGNIRLPAVMTAMRFMLLFMVLPTLAAVEVKPGPRGACTTKEYSGHLCMDELLVYPARNHAPIIDECVKYENFIIQNKPSMLKEQEMAKQYESAIGPTSFPAFPTVKCPDMQTVVHDILEYGGAINTDCNCCTPASLPGKARYLEGLADTLIAFINEFNKKSEDFHNRLTPYLEAKQQQEKAETARRIAEAERQNAVLAKQNAEIIRQNAELAKQYAEIMRQNAEIIRMKTEEENKGAIRHALAVMQTVSEYMDEHMSGKSYQLNPRYQQAFDFFLNNPEHCISAPDEECKRELASIANIELLSKSVSDEEFIQELTGAALKEQTTGL